MVKRTLFVVLALLLVAAIPAMAQTTASLTGTVTSGGSPLPGVTVSGLKLHDTPAGSFVGSHWRPTALAYAPFCGATVTVNVAL